MSGAPILPPSHHDTAELSEPSDSAEAVVPAESSLLMMHPPPPSTLELLNAGNPDADPKTLVWLTNELRDEVQQWNPTVDDIAEDGVVLDFSSWTIILQSISGLCHGAGAGQRMGLSSPD